MFSFEQRQRLDCATIQGMAKVQSTKKRAEDEKRLAKLLQRMERNRIARNRKYSA